MTAPKHKQQRDQRAEQRPEPTVDAVMLDPDFDELEQAEFVAWRWPERDHD
ncbi:hypothetical protein [Bradyrhizobium sp. 162]|uniref:hypothetical protein n=1 Tax=Bradyrhizobium sp. 162 TaxID=2782635 RepID=UPI001FF99AAE|nr:hypothetical protein [Bradyrhizobium sp. 162]MCK1629663.1 hypothetical protein [Bradyrhizobium sp. 162]